MIGIPYDTLEDGVDKYLLIMYVCIDAPITGTRPERCLVMGGCEQAGIDDPLEEDVHMVHDIILISVCMFV